MKTLTFILLFAFSVPVLATPGGDEKSGTTTMSARIVDKHGEAVAGAKVMIRETGQTVFTDFEGSFKIQLDKKANFTLQVDMVGFEPQTVPSGQLMTGELTLTFL